MVREKARAMKKKKSIKPDEIPVEVWKMLEQGG